MVAHRGRDRAKWAVLVLVVSVLVLELAVVPVVVAHRARPNRRRRHKLGDPQSPVMRGNNRLTSPRLGPAECAVDARVAVTFSDIESALSTPFFNQGSSRDDT
jgi:hypothetical protein